MRKKVKGYKETRGRTKIACAFEDKLFLKIKRMAEKDCRSFSSVVEELCRVGMLDLEESDRLEPSPLKEARH